MGKSKKYNREFQLQTCRLVVDQGYTLKEAADRLGPCTWTIREWIKKYQASGELPASGQGCAGGRRDEAAAQAESSSWNWRMRY